MDMVMDKVKDNTLSKQVIHEVEEKNKKIDIFCDERIEKIFLSLY